MLPHAAQPWNFSEVVISTGPLWVFGSNQSPPTSTGILPCPVPSNTPTLKHHQSPRALDLGTDHRGFSTHKQSSRVAEYSAASIDSLTVKIHEFPLLCWQRGFAVLSYLSPRSNRASFPSSVPLFEDKQKVFAFLRRTQGSNLSKEAENLTGWMAKALVTQQKKGMKLKTPL